MTGITSDDKKLSSTLGNGPAEVNLAYTEEHWNVDYSTWQNSSLADKSIGVAIVQS